jgi:peptidoglycan/LPS O-acetylase OafA/YrhL
MKKKVDLLLIVRGILAVSVLFWHIEGYKETIPHIFNIPGRTAVWIFFGISG